MLIRTGHEIFQAGNGKPALHLAGRLNLDLILMDWQMPETDGLEAAECGDCRFCAESAYCAGTFRKPK